MAIYIDGTWRAAHSSDRIPVENPATEEIIAEVPDCDAADVDAAVAAARAALPAWSSGSAQDRICLMRRTRRDMLERRAELADVITAEIGTPTNFANKIQAGMALRALGSFIDALPEGTEPQQLDHSMVVPEPVGVVAAITPWNYPLNQVVAKVMAAIAAGCTVVVKPSELAPLSAQLFIRLLAEADLPAGVVNLVTGSGPVVGDALVRHPEVDMVSFTGSTAVGTRIAAAAAEGVKRVALELGGKSAAVVLPDGDLPAAVLNTVRSCMANAGQTCTALSRLVVPRKRCQEAAEQAAALMANYRIGDPTDPETKLGPLVSSAHRDRVRGHIARAREEGLREIPCGPPDRLPERGHYLAPAVFVSEDPGASLAQEEVFGPVLCVLPYDTEDEAVDIANGTPFGLAGSVWSADVPRALAVAGRIRVGRIEVNGVGPGPGAPFGGRRRSGYGYELGPHGLREFQVLKSLGVPA
ncbi:aldehyde dehydrogenase family protein [Rugosimonospora africana]|nr:aldehyde dehydrogenase family protein [Rugosimonospora africana]